LIYGAHTVCFCPLITILDPPLEILVISSLIRSLGPIVSKQDFGILNHSVIKYKTQCSRPLNQEGSPQVI
jgi:hypothetical protein